MELTALLHEFSRPPSEAVTCVFFHACVFLPVGAVAGQTLYLLSLAFRHAFRRPSFFKITPAWPQLSQLGTTGSRTTPVLLMWT
ncbi:hypothetical protein GALMADRAFT_403996 [Galerina marginata CBS 339.88]|uniref:Uncharacterized protein n=1 Tax=Galerina marginata (strain CBS 339.88) TaxID=685588 RepID=A0A067TSI9_GALM3|nr:hypothetical protein GALMADRAFT_403996 [Galerina marginata CBS 339.88]